MFTCCLGKEDCESIGKNEDYLKRNGERYNGLDDFEDVSLSEETPIIGNHAETHNSDSCCIIL